MLTALCALTLAVQSPGLQLSGRVVGADGEPIPAHVVVGCQSLIPFAPVPFEVLAGTKAAADGGFSVELPAEWIQRRGYRELDVFAWLDGHGIARQHWSVAELPVGFEPVLRLPPAEEARVRFVDSGGLPVAGARVWPQGLVNLGRGEFRMPVAWWREHAATTDTDGWATLPVALERLERIGFEAEGFGLQNLARDWRSKGPLPDELEVLRPVERSLHFEGPAPEGTVVEIDGFRMHDLEDGAKYVTQLEWRGRIQGDPPFTVLAMEGQVLVSFVTEDASALALGHAVADESEERPASGALRVPRPDTYEVRGRVVSELDGSPVAGARLRVRAVHKGWVESGEDGRFEFDCGPPGFSLDTLVAPEGFASVQFLKGFNGRQPEDGGDVDLGDVRVQPTWTATGVVLGPDGAPASGVWVVGHQKFSSGRFTSNVNLSAVTDADGRYSMPGARSGLSLDVVARLGDKTGKASQSPDSPLELVLSRALSARGSLRLPDGAPAAGVALEVWQASPPKVSGGEDLVALGGNHAFETGADGSFESAGGLEADAKYCLVWSGGSIESGRSDWFTGEELAAGIEVAVKRLGVVRGVIRRGDRTPLAGAEVRLRRGAATSTTDENGEFELAGVPAEGDVLVALEPGAAPRVRWIDPLEMDVDWRLLPEGPERPLSPAPEPDRGRELELAFELLEKGYQEAVEAGDESQLLRAVQNLAWADPALVLERVEAGLFETGWMRDFSLAYVADALLEDSPEESLAVSMRLDRGMSRALSVLDAAERLDAAAEREQLALVRAEARAVDPPEHRVVVLARLADRLLDLGEVEAAMGVLAEGRVVAEALPPEDWPGYARSRFGEVLSRVDAEAGRALIDELASAGDRPRHLFNTAHELAASDPAAAQALMAEVASNGGIWSPERYVSRIVHRMAPVDLERARELAARYDRTGFADGMIALALADANPMEARASLGQAFRRAEKLAEGSLQWSERPVASAAALLPVAERVDPGGLRGYVARAVAIRRPPSRGHFGGDDVVWREDATLAFYLARWQPALATQLLLPAVDAARKLRGYELGSEYDAVWAAAAVSDPEWAAALGRELGGRAAAKVGLVLALPPAHRTTYVQEKIVGLWVVGKEDL